MQRIFLHILLLLGSLFLAFLLLEILARSLVHVPEHVMRDPYVGRRLTPNVEVVSKGPHWEGRNRINSLGWNAPEFSLKKLPGIFRIVHIGDSQVEGMYVGTEKAFAKTVSALLPGVESINMGVGGQGTYPELLTYRHYARTYGPDVTFLWFNPGNDFRDNFLVRHIIGSGGMVPEIASPGQAWFKTVLLERLRLPRFLYNSFSGNHLLNRMLIRLGLLAMEPEEFQEEIPLSYRTSVIDTPERSQAVEATRVLLKGFKEEVLQGTLVLGLIPSYLETSPGAEEEFRTLYPGGGDEPLDPDFSSETIRRIAEELELPLLDLTPIFRDAYAHGQKPHIENEGHLSLEGNRIVAAEVARFLREKGYKL